MAGRTGTRYTVVTEALRVSEREMNHSASDATEAHRDVESHESTRIAGVDGVRPW